MKIIKNYPAKPFGVIYERVAMKTHVCDCCKKEIISGTTYFNKKGVTENHSFYDIKYCDLCYSKKNI